MTAPAPHREHRVFPVLTLPVFDLRVGDVVVGTDSEIIESMRTTRGPVVSPSGIRVGRPPTSRTTARMSSWCIVDPPRSCRPRGGGGAGSNTGGLVGIRCPRCGTSGRSSFRSPSTSSCSTTRDSAAPGQPTAGHVPPSIRRADSPTATPSSATKVGAAAATAGRSKSSASARRLTPRVTPAGGSRRRAVAPPGVDTLDAWTRTHRR